MQSCGPPGTEFETSGLESRTRNQKVVSSSFGPAGIVGEGSECTALSPPSIPRRGALEQDTETSTAPPVSQHKSAQGVCSRCVCTMCTWMGKCRARILSMGHHSLLYVTSLSLSIFCLKIQ